MLFSNSTTLPNNSSKYFKDWLLTQKIQIIWHPPQLLNLNLIEHPWNEGDHHMRMSEKKPTNKKDLWKKIDKI